MVKRLKGILIYFLLILSFFSAHKVEAQYKIISISDNMIDTLFMRLPLDANIPGKYLLKIKELAKKSDISTQVKIFTNIGTYYLRSEMSDSARLYFQKGLELGQKNKTGYFKAICLMGLARIHGHFAEYDDGISKLNQALALAIKTDSSELISSIYRIYGNIYWGMEIYDLAYENYNKSLEIAKEINFSENISAAYNNIGNIYSSTKDYENAQKYLRLAFEAAKINDHKWVMAISANNIGTNLTTLGEYDSALYFYRISRGVSRELGGRMHEGIVNLNMGETYLKLDSLDLAKIFLTHSYKIAIETNDNIGLANSLLLLGQLDMVNGDFIHAKQFIDSGMITSINLGSLSLQQQAIESKTRYFKKVNNPDSIVKYMEKLLFLKDTLSRIENLENITRLEFKYKEKVASQEIELLQKEKRINKLLIFMGGSVSILVLFILSFLLIHGRRRYKELTRNNNLIAEQQELLQIKNSELIISQNELEKMIYAKDRFITIMSHDLKNPVGAVRGFLELILSNYDNLDDQKKIKFLREVFRSVENISLLIDNVLYWIKSQNKSVISQPALFNASDGISANISLYSFIANWKKIKLRNDTNKDHFVFSDRNIFDTIIRNLLSNSLKFTNEGGEIIFRSSKDEFFITIELEDTGMGMSKSQLAEIFDTPAHQTSNGTSNEKGTGLGLGLVNEFVNIIGASFSINSIQGKGTTFSLKFPFAEK